MIGIPIEGLPHGWSSLKLADLCGTNRDTIVDGPFGSNLKRSHYQETGVPVLKIQNIRPNSIELKKMDYVSAAKYDELRRHSFERGDIVMTKLGNPLGVSAIVENIDRGLIVADLVRIRPGMVNSKFLCYQLNSPLVSAAINASQKGTTRPRINLSIVRNLPVAVPSMPEQEKIVEILEEQLSRLDAALANVRTIREKTAQFRRSLLYAAFTGALTGHDQSSTNLPGGWNPVRLGDFGKWLGGGTPSKSNPLYWTNGEVPWLSPKDMGELVLRGTQDRITREAVERSTTKIVKAPSVAVVVRSGILEHTLPVSLISFDTSLNQDMKALEPNADVLPKWATYGMKAFEQEILDTCRKAGTTVASIELRRLMNFAILVPPLAEQKKIVEILEEQLSRLDGSLVAADAVEKRASALRRSLLHAAFTGKLTERWREGSHV